MPILAASGSLPTDALDPQKIVGDAVFDGRMTERDHGIAVHERHIAEVRATIPAELLLVFHVGEGWGRSAGFSASRSRERRFHGPALWRSSAC